MSRRSVHYIAIHRNETRFIAVVNCAADVASYSRIVRTLTTLWSPFFTVELNSVFSPPHNNQSLNISHYKPTYELSVSLNNRIWDVLVFVQIALNFVDCYCPCCGVPPAYWIVRDLGKHISKHILSAESELLTCQIRKVLLLGWWY